jgi:CDP-glucose 4,6-dehydratase
MTTLDEYKGKKVLITGHTGFKGAWLAIWLEMLGAKVSGYALDPLYEDGIFIKSGIKEKIHDYRGDVRDLNGMLEIFRNEKPEVVFHLAAQALLLEGYRNPVETFEINIQGTVNVLEAIRQSPSIKSAVFITTDKCYENKEWIWGYRENDPMGGYDPYSASKGAAELVISAYRRSFFTKSGKAGIASARAGNVVGGGDWSENRLVPDIIKAILENKTIDIRNPHATRPWQYVLEPLRGYLDLGLALLKNPIKYSEGWNFGPYTHEIYTVKQVVEQILTFTKKGNWRDLSASNAPHEANLLLLDISKAVQKLHWRPVLTFKESIEYTIDWYLNSLNSNISGYTRNQINSYMDLWKSRKEN